MEKDYRRNRTEDDMPSMLEMMSGAEHFVIDIDTHIAHPSDDSVEEMRLWSIENEK